MLGEPGIGKSTEFESECNRIKAETATTDDKIVHMDLKEYQTDMLSSLP